MMHYDEKKYYWKTRRQMIYNIFEMSLIDNATCQVPGVSENRPSVLRGDSLLVYPAEKEKVKYRGYVHSVQLDSVKLGFSSQ